MNEDTYRDKLTDLQIEVEALRAKLKESQEGDTISRQAALTALTSTAGVGNRALDKIRALPSAQPKIIRCKDCIYYDPEHIENNGIRYEYKDMPKEAFDELETGLVHIGYGINVCGRCCRDYNVGYSEDKRIFVPETNYCGRAERRTDE